MLSAFGPSSTIFNGVVCVGLFARDAAFFSSLIVNGSGWIWLRLLRFASSFAASLPIDLEASGGSICWVFF